jgi:hypothetical protein
MQAEPSHAFAAGAVALFETLRIDAISAKDDAGRCTVPYSQSKE